MVVEPDERDQELEEREARDRVEQRGDDADRLLEPPEAVREEREREREHEADADRDQRQLDVLDERAAERVAPVLAAPSPSRRCGRP